MADLISKLGIDWRLLIAQLINFAILFVVLWRFAYKPIMGMLSKRRHDIEKGIKFTSDAEENLKSVGEQKVQIIGEAKNQAVTIVDQAQFAARSHKDEIIKETAKKADSMIDDAKRVAGEEKLKIDAQAYAEAENLIRLGLEKVLQKMPDEARDEHLIKEALKELKTVKS